MVGKSYPYKEEHNNKLSSYLVFTPIGIKYIGEDRRVIITVCKRIEAIRLKKKVNEIDRDAFVVANNTTEIIGRGIRSV